MADYTTLDIKTVKKLIAEYDLGKFTSMTPLEGGQANSSLKISTQKGVYTLSVCDEKSQEEIHCLTRVLTHLKAQNFPSTRLISTQSGKPFILYGDKPVYVKAFLAGEVCRNLSSGMLFQTGQAMAKLHGLAVLPGLPGQFPYGLTAFDEILDRAHPYVDWLGKKQKFLETAIDKTMAKGFIHGDLFWDNLLFSGGKLVAILDFEEACIYYKLFDIGMAALGCCTDDGRLAMNRVKQLVAGYQQISPLTDAEKNQLKIFMEYAGVASSFWRFRQYNIRYPLPEKKDNYLELSRLADQIHTMNENRFYEIFKN